MWRRKQEESSLERRLAAAPSLWLDARREAMKASQVIRLPLRRQGWKGPAGQHQGVGMGNSLEFEDHRAYAPGDDLRHLDWTAYARTDQLLMKQHRHEAAPQVDLAFDLSASHWLYPLKAARFFELLAFSLQSALQCRSGLRLWAVGQSVEACSMEALMEARLPAQLGRPVSGAPALDRVPWRQDALRVWISDLLFPIPSTHWFAQLGGRRGRGLVLCPVCREESHPDWVGPCVFKDVESHHQLDQLMNAEVQTRYQKAYRGHFTFLREAALRAGVSFACIEAEPGLVEALITGAAREGILEWV